MILFTADLHIDEKIIAEGLLPKFAEWLEEMRRLYKVSALVILGDIWHKHLDTKREVSFGVLDAITKFLNSLEFDSIIMLKGNHDESFIGLHNLTIFSLDKRIQIIDTPSPITFPYNDKKGNKQVLETFFIPFCKEKDYFDSIINQAPETSIICMHQTIRTFMLNSKKMSEDGVSINKPFPLVISGDLHDFQSRDNIVYIGSPYQTRRGESPQKQIIMFSDGKFFPVEVPGKISQRFIYVESLDEVEQYDLKGKTVVVTGNNVDVTKLDELRNRGVNVVSSGVIDKADATATDIDLTTFSVDIIRNVVDANSNEYFKLIGSDILQMLESEEDI